MSKTEEYEHLLDRKNVVGVEWDEDNQRVVVLVTEKIPEDLLDDEDIISKQLGEDEDSDVIEGGEPTLEAAPTGKFRPVVSGISEGPIDDRMAGTGGPVAEVTDPFSEYWDDSVSVGDKVRISNCHVYAEARAEAGTFDNTISQPATIDGGNSSDTVGDLVGYVPLVDGRKVDCAARTLSDDEVNQTRGLNEDYPTGIRRDYSDLRGENGTKSGRTTGVTSDNVVGTSATVRVNIGDGRTVTFRDMIITPDMSDGGDSGSEFYDSVGRLTGLLFAGSDRITIFCKIANVENEFGVEMVTGSLDEPAEPPEIPEPQELTIDGGKHFGTVEYSFAVSDESTVDFGGHSDTQVGNRVNGWVMLGWDKNFTIHGQITDASIPEGAAVKLNGEPVAPDELVERSRKLANS